MSIPDDFQQFVDQVKAAISQFITGNAASFKACWSHADDVTICGGWGAYEQGWEQVGPRLDWAAARFLGGTLTYEWLAQGMSGDLAYTIWLEKNVVRVVGQGDRGPVVLRVTHLYRREEGSWKIIHRHADAIIEKIEATAVLQR
jgi:ketosteroid isomerase-like protein